MSWKCSQVQSCLLPRGEKKTTPKPWSFITTNVAEDFYFSLGICCSELVPDTSHGVVGDIIPIAISSKPATQSIHKFKCTHYQEKQENIKTHLWPFSLNQRPHHAQMCPWRPQEARPQKAVKKKKLLRESRKFFSMRKLQKGPLSLIQGQIENTEIYSIPESFPNSPTSELPGQFIFSIQNYNYLGLCLISKICQCSFQRRIHVWFSLYPTKQLICTY